MLHVLNVVLTCRYLVPGWRLGWVLIYDKNEAFESEVMNSLKSSINKLQCIQLNFNYPDPNQYLNFSLFPVVDTRFLSNSGLLVK